VHAWCKDSLPEGPVSVTPLHVPVREQAALIPLKDSDDFKIDPWSDEEEWDVDMNCNRASDSSTQSNRNRWSELCGIRHAHLHSDKPFRSTSVKGHVFCPIKSTSMISNLHSALSWHYIDNSG
jgi:hypothetical protein